jgi:hypothetical protein
MKANRKQIPVWTTGDMAVNPEQLGFTGSLTRSGVFLPLPLLKKMVLKY